MGPSLRHARVLALALSLAFGSLLSGCPSPTSDTDAGSDAAMPRDAGGDGGAGDSGTVDGGTIDGGDVDASASPDAGFDAAAIDGGGAIDAARCDAAAGAVELCNGIDDDCDGMVDPGCICPIAAPVPILDGDEWSLAALSGGSFALASQDFGTGALAVQRYGSDFAPVGGRITLVVDTARPADDLMLFALGTGFGAAWRQWPSSSVPSNDLWFAAGASALTTTATDLTPMAGVLGHSVAPLGTGFVVARNEPGPASSSLAVRIVDATGHVTAGPHPLSESFSVSYTGVGVVGSTIGVAYQADDGTGMRIRFQRFDASAQPIGASIALDTGTGATHPVVAAQSSGWGVAWDDGSATRFAALDAAGTITVPARMIAPSGGFQGLSIAADGAGHWGVLHRASGGARFHYLDAAGVDRGPAITPGTGYSVTGQPSLVFDGTRFVASLLGTTTALWVPCPAM